MTAHSLHSLQLPNDKPVAVITGATGGMGAAIVADLLPTHTVVALGRNVDKLTRLEAMGAYVVESDMLGEAVPAEIANIERCDVLVHCAAVATKKPLEELNSSAWFYDLTINLIAPAEITRALLPALRAARGIVVFINSGAGLHGKENLSLYCASKHALYGLADSLRMEEAENGVRVTTVSPGPTDTNMLRGLRRGQQYNAEDFIEPREIARAVRACISAGPSAQFTELRVRPRQE